MATVLTRTIVQKDKSEATIVTKQDEVNSSQEEITGKIDIVGLNLGLPADEKRFWWQRGKTYDPNAIATQPSVFDDPETAKVYQPRADWENLRCFDPSARWTWAEEYALIRKIDFKIMIFACIMFMALELDRSNLTQAVTDNFLSDLGMDTNDYNWGNTVFKLSFLAAELPSQLVSKWIGPDRWIPTQMVLWSIVAGSQFWLNGRTTFLLTRSLLALLQGGFIPDMILYLSYFYKHSELSIRLAFWWTAMSIADIIAAFLGFGVLHLRGHLGYSATPSLYLTLSLKELGFGTFKTNLLVIPSQVGHIITMLTTTYLSEVFGQLWLWGIFAQIWVLPCLSFIYAVDINSINKWAAFGVMTVLLAYPSVHPIQSSGIIASNIYREDDKPRYRRGNRALLAINVLNIGLYIFAKVYYTLRNRYRDRKWNEMTEEQRAEYLATTTDQGNKRLDFRFAT
ncbi:hypothetical protein DV737_g5318, partial [Chaetothyriales sp. CBS 132003]